jgi:DNA polymerase
VVTITKINSLDQLHEEYARDPAFKYLKDTRGVNCINLVKGYGPTDSPNLMLVGAAPGRLENERGIPFMGPAGYHLVNLFSDINVNLSEVYLTNVVKYWPHGEFDRNNKYIPSSDQRDVTEEEFNRSVDYFRQEIDLVGAGLVGLCGAQAINAVFPDLKNPFYYNGKILDEKYVILYHPAIIHHKPNQKALVKTGFIWLKNHLDRM